jgi:hypothetical protein
MTRGTMVIIMFAGFVTKFNTAIVVNAVSAFNEEPLIATAME